MVVVVVVVVNESDFSVHTWTMARPLANSILTYHGLIFDYSLGADNTETSLLDTARLTRLRDELS